MKVKDMIKWLQQYEDDKYEAVIGHDYNEKEGEIHFIDIYQDNFNEDNFVDQLPSDTDDWFY